MAVDDNWPEVLKINSYAIFMGYLLMGVRGLGLLVLTWTTVVLLGGFVSMLQKKDFWCLTVITLVQTAGVFLLKEKASDIGNYLKGMVVAQAAAALRPFKKDRGTLDSSKEKEDKVPSTRCVVAFFLLVMVQLLVLAPVLCLVAALYVLGLYISAGISLWRLIEHDYGGDAEGGANLKPALNVLYSLVVAQGVVFGYKTVYDMVAKAGLVEEVADCYSLDTDIVKDYLDEIVTGCMKDPSFARGRNLMTYAGHLLMESKSRYGYISGVIILGTALLPSEDYRRHERAGLIEQLLIGSASFSHVVQRLMETFGPTSPYSTEIRERAARIVANVAPSILMEKLPGEEMIPCISSLLDTFEEYSWRPEGYDRPSYLPKEYERGWLLDQYYPSIFPIPQESDSGNPLQLQGYKGLVVQGLRILQELAVHEGNCRVIISNTTDQGQLSKTMVPLFSEQLHEDHHDEWTEIAVESMELMSRLMAAPGDTGSKLRSEISGSGKAAIVANNILVCSKCGVFLKRQAMEILLDVSVDTLPCITSRGSNNTIFLGSLLHIFLLPDYCFIPTNFMPIRYGHYYRKMRGSTHLAKKSSYITRLAGEKLQSAKSMSLQSSVAAVVADLAKISVDVANNLTHRLHAVRILEDLCQWYTKDDEYLNELKKVIAEIMPMVLKEITCFGSTNSPGTHAKTEANNNQVSARRTDIEKGVVGQGNAQEDASSSQQQSADEQYVGIRLQEAFIFMCTAIHLSSWGHRQFDGLAAKTCSEQGISEPVKDLKSLASYAEVLLYMEAQRLATQGSSS